MREEHDPSSFEPNNLELLINKFEVMLSEEELYFFDVAEFEDMIDYYLVHQKLKQARRALKLAKSQHPASLEFALKEAELYTMSNEHESAIRLLSQIELIDKSNPDVFITKAGIYNKKGDFTKAISNYKKALALCPEEERESLLMSIAYEYQNMDNVEMAVVYLKKINQQFPENIDALYELMYCYEEMDAEKEGVKFYQSVTEAQPFNQHAWFLLGNQQSAAGMFEDAVKSYDFTVVLNENFEAAHFSKANILSRLGRYDEAVEAYKQTIKINPDNYITYYYVGECMENREDFAEAIYYYHKAAEMQDDFGEAFQGIAACYLELGHLEEAKKYINKAIQTDTDNPEYWSTLADVEVARGEFELAVFAYERIIDQDPEDQEVYIDYTELVYNSKSPIDALRVATDGLEKFQGNVELMFLTAALYYLIGSKEEATELLAVGLRECPELQEAAFRLDPKLVDDPDFRGIIEEIENEL